MCRESSLVGVKMNDSCFSIFDWRTREKIWTRWDRGLVLRSGASQHLELQQKDTKENEEVIEMRENTRIQNVMDDKIKQYLNKDDKEMATGFETMT